MAGKIAITSKPANPTAPNTNPTPHTRNSWPTQKSCSRCSRLSGKGPGVASWKPSMGSDKRCLQKVASRLALHQMQQSQNGLHDQGVRCLIENKG